MKRTSIPLLLLGLLGVENVKIHRAGGSELSQETKHMRWGLERVHELGGGDGPQIGRYSKKREEETLV